MEGFTTPTGFIEQIDHTKGIPDFDPRSGDHLWCLFSVYKINPAKLAKGEQALLDHEALLSVEGPGCFYCEKAYDPQLATRRCKGRP